MWAMIPMLRWVSRPFLAAGGRGDSVLTAVDMEAPERFSGQRSYLDSPKGQAVSASRIVGSDPLPEERTVRADSALRQALLDDLPVGDVVAEVPGNRLARAVLGRVLEMDGEVGL